MEIKHCNLGDPDAEKACFSVTGHGVVAEFWYGCGDPEVTKEQAEAAARLFAAGPDMLAALKGILKPAHWPGPKEWEAAADAVHKAEGQS